MTPLAERDHALLVRLVDEQIAPMRRFGYVLLGLSTLPFLVAVLEFSDAMSRSENAGLPMGTVAGAAIGVALAALGVLAWRSNRNPLTHFNYQLLVAQRDQITRVELQRVLNRTHDRFYVHTQLRPMPLMLLVRSQDREAVAALLSRAYPHVGR